MAPMINRGLLLVSVLCGCLAALAPSPCHAVCGDGFLDPQETCDDGNLIPWDGCSASCGYEYAQRIVTLGLAGGVGPAQCTPGTNGFGNAFSVLAREGLNLTLQGGLDDGSLDVITVLTGLDDPAGAEDPDVAIALVPAVPDPADGGLGLDSLHWGSGDAFDGAGQPVSSVGGTLAQNVFTAGPEDFIVPASDTDDFVLTDGYVVATVGAATSTPAPPPTLLAPGFTTFETIDGTTPLGGLCGNITVGSLALVPIPEDFGAGGALQCRDACSGSRAYTSCGETGVPGVDCNSLLDVLVSGCSNSILCLRLVTPTQPDVGAGGGTPLVLTADPTTGFVQVVEPLDAYSTAFDFTSVRVHLTHGPNILIDGFESGTLDAWTN
jgi:cysteine-rich repeat protein